MAVNIGTISKSRPTTCYTMQRPAPTAERRESNGVTFASSSACNWSLLLQHVRTGCALYSCFGYSRSERAEANKQWKWLRKSGQNRKCVKLNLCKMIRFDSHCRNRFRNLRVIRAKADHAMKTVAIKSLSVYFYPKANDGNVCFESLIIWGLNGVFSFEIMRKWQMSQQILVLVVGQENNDWHF